MEKGEVQFFGDTADLLRRPDILRAVYVKGTGALTDGAPARRTRSERERRGAGAGRGAGRSSRSRASSSASAASPPSTA